MSITTLPSLFGVLAVSTLTATVCSDVVQSQPPVDPDLYSIVPEKNFLEHEYQPHSLMMRFRESASPEARAELLASVGGTIVTSYHLVPDLVDCGVGCGPNCNKVISYQLSRYSLLLTITKLSYKQLTQAGGFTTYKYLYI